MFLSFETIRKHLTMYIDVKEAKSYAQYISNAMWSALLLNLCCQARSDS